MMENSSEDDDFGEKPKSYKGGEETDSDTEARLEIPGIEQPNFGGIRQVNRLKSCFSEFFNIRGYWEEVYMDENTTREEMIDAIMDIVNPLFRDIHDYLVEVRENEWQKLLSEAEWIRVVRYSAPFMALFMLATNMEGDHIQINGRRYNLNTMFNIAHMKHESIDDFQERAIFDGLTFLQKMVSHREILQSCCYYELFKYIMAGYVGFPRGALVSNWQKRAMNWQSFRYLLSIHNGLKFHMRRNYRIFFDVIQLQMNRRTMALRREAALASENNPHLEEIRFVPALLTLMKPDATADGSSFHGIVMDPQIFSGVYSVPLGH